MSSNGKKKKKGKGSQKPAVEYKGKNAAPVVKPVKKPEPKPELKPEPNQGSKPIPKSVIEPSKKISEHQYEVIQPQKSLGSNKLKQKRHPKTGRIQCLKKKFAKKGGFKKQVAQKLKELGVYKLSVIALAASVLIACISVGAWLLFSRFSVPKEAEVEYMGRNVDEYSAFIVEDDLATQYKFTEGMKRKGDRKLFRYYAATRLELAEKDSYANLNLVNVFDNGCVFIASIVDEAGCIHYQSLGLPAGMCLSEVTLRNMSYGTHDMKLVVAAYDPETYKHLGTQYSDLTVQVGFEKEVTDVEESEVENK